MKEPAARIKFSDQIRVELRLPERGVSPSGGLDWNLRIFREYESLPETEFNYSGVLVPDVLLHEIIRDLKSQLGDELVLPKIEEIVETVVTTAITYIEGLGL